MCRSGIQRFLTSRTEHRDEQKKRQQIQDGETEKRCVSRCTEGAKTSGSKEPWQATLETVRIFQLLAIEEFIVNDHKRPIF